jgi:hypothetical protein
MLPDAYGASSLRMMSSSDAPCQRLWLSNSCVFAKRANALLDDGHEIRYRPAVPRLGDDRTHRRQHILHAVVKLSIQKSPLFLSPFAFRDIASYAD